MHVLTQIHSLALFGEHAHEKIKKKHWLIDDPLVFFGKIPKFFSSPDLYVAFHQLENIYINVEAIRHDWFSIIPCEK